MNKTRKLVQLVNWIMDAFDAIMIMCTIYMLIIYLAVVTGVTTVGGITIIYVPFIIFFFSTLLPIFLFVMYTLFLYKVFYNVFYFVHMVGTIYINIVETNRSV